jgi:hypothetical protein
MKIFKHNWLAHLIGVGAILIAIGLIYKLACDPKIPPHARNVFISVATAYILIVLFFYLTSGLNRYEVTEEGLRVYRPFRSKLYPWAEIATITWNRPLNTFFVCGPNQMIFYSSTNCFPKLLEFIRILHSRSDCKLSPWLSKKLSPGQKP